MTNQIIPQRVCSIANCGVTKRVQARSGYCLNHHRRWLRYGNPLQFYQSFGDTAADRFWSRVTNTSDPNACWEWQGKRERKGYGRKKYDGNMHLAHHIAWHLTYGVFPTEDLLHSCDNPPCVNPNHLREGSHYDNVRDRQEKQRQARGDRHPFSILSEADIPIIRQRLAAGHKMTEIAPDFNIGSTAIFAIKHGLTWKHV